MLALILEVFHLHYFSHTWRKTFRKLLSWWGWIPLYPTGFTHIIPDSTQVFVITNNNNEDDDDLSTQTWAEFLIDSGYSYKKSFILSQTFIVFYFANSLSIYFLCKNFIFTLLNYITVIKSAVRSTRLQSKKFPSLLFHLIMHN